MNIHWVILTLRPDLPMVKSWFFSIHWVMLTMSSYLPMVLAWFLNKRFLIKLVRFIIFVKWTYIFVSLDHKTSHISQSSESWIDMLSIDVWFVRIGQYLDGIIQLFKNLESEGDSKNNNIEILRKCPKFLAMRFTNQKLSCDIFTVGNVQNIFMIHDL